MDNQPRRLDEVDEASNESFPASDPPSYTAVSAMQPDTTSPPECYEAAFERAACRIEILDQSAGDMPTFVARMVVVDPDSGRIRPLSLDSGERAEVHGRTASQALSAALTFLGEHFGPPTVYEHHCRQVSDVRPDGPAVVLRQSAH